MKIIVIAAVASNDVIGKDNKIPWSIPDDMKRFSRLTSGNTVIMGRKTFESMKKVPLKNRNNIVVSSTMSTHYGVLVSKTLTEAIERAKTYNRDIYIIGGEKIYEEALPIADVLEITHINREYDGDVKFPYFDKSKWTVSCVDEREVVISEESFKYAYTTYTKK